MIMVGCCGFAGGRESYCRRFSLVEVQQSFYKPPALPTVRRWREQAPPGFIFTIKAWQLITHPPSSPTYRRAGLCIAPEQAARYGLFQDTAEVWAAWERTWALAQELGAWAILFQCPARFTPEPLHVANLRAFFRALPRGGIRIVWEPRGPWPPELVRDLCGELALVHGVDPFQEEPAPVGAIRYFRLHGGPRYRHRYTDAELERLRALVLGDLGPCGKPQEVYCLFNNRNMLEDAQRFLALLEREQGVGEAHHP